MFCLSFPITEVYIPNAHLNPVSKLVSKQMNLEQIRNAVLETVYLGVIEAYLRAKTVASYRLDVYNGMMTWGKMQVCSGCART